VTALVRGDTSKLHSRPGLLFSFSRAAVGHDLQYRSERLCLIGLWTLANHPARRRR
jgi:hypothetical protein